MIALIDRRAFVWYATVSVALVFLLQAANYYDLIDIDADDIPLWYRVIHLHGAILGITLVLTAVGHAWERNQHKLAVLIFLVWPLAFVYALMVNSRPVNNDVVG